MSNFFDKNGKPRFSYEDVVKDLEFFIDQSHIIEHAQDYNEMCRLREKYGKSY